MSKTVTFPEAPTFMPKKRAAWDEVQAPAPSEPSVERTESEPAGIAAGRLAVWALIASEIVIFAGLLGSFILFRLAHPEWAAEAKHLNLLAGTINTVILLASNFFMMKASAAVEKGDTGAVKKFLMLTQVAALAFLSVKWFEYSLEFMRGEFPWTSNFWSFYFLLTGIHALHIVGGVVALAMLWVTAVRGKLEPIKGRVALVGLYWSFVEVVWMLLFPLLYLLA